MSNLPYGLSDNGPEINGHRCKICGAHGCDCEDDGDPRSFRERALDAKGEHDADCDRDEGKI